MQSTVLFLQIYLSIIFHEAFAIIISPCKVQNLVTHPTFGTSLRTKNLVQIVQMPPVFVQTVMIGICENRNQNVSTGRMGEFYSCQQRYSVVDVYIADPPDMLSAHQAQGQLTPDYLSSIRFVRESVIIESGCDFTFNLLPLMASVQDQNQPDVPTGEHAVPPQQKMFLRSPYHPNPTLPIRVQPQQANTPHGIPSPNVPLSQHQQSTASHTPQGYPPIYTQGRSGQDTEDTADTDETESDDE